MFVANDKRQTIDRSHTPMLILHTSLFAEKATGWIPLDMHQAKVVALIRNRDQHGDYAINVQYLANIGMKCQALNHCMNDTSLI